MGSRGPKRIRQVRGPNILNDRSEAIWLRAMQLGEAGREDPAAVAELVRLAQGRRQDLLAAEREVYRDSDVYVAASPNRALRLLRAAIDGTDVRAPADEDRSAIERTEYLESLSPDTRWALLVELEPRLASLEQDVVEGRIVTPIDLNLSLNRLVGPSSNGQDWLMNSKTVLDAVGERLFPLLLRSRVEPIASDPRVTLWEKVHDLRYANHCIVCDLEASQSERRAMVFRRHALGVSGVSGLVHRRCWRVGEARARDEGVGWSDSNRPIRS